MVDNIGPENGMTEVFAHDSRTAERNVELLLRRAEAEKQKGSYDNWPLKDVPFAVLWNEFSRSGIHLTPENYGH